MREIVPRPQCKRKIQRGDHFFVAEIQKSVFEIFAHCRPLHGGPKIAPFYTPSLYQILTDFQNYFTVRIRRTITPTTSQVCRYTTLWNVKGTSNSVIDWIQVRAVIGSTCQARWTWRSHAAGTSVCSRSWQCVYLQQMVYQHRRFTTINQLKQAIVTEWGKLSQRFIDRAIGQWRRRLECVVRQQSGHSEHLM